MAHMYTTKRGKNKKGKEAVRRDHANNQERKLKTSEGPDLTGFAGKDKIQFGISGHLMGGGATGVPSNATRIKERPQDKLKAMLNPGKCTYFQCLKTARDCTLLACSVCNTSKYCSRECQVTDWGGGEPPHRQVCKLLKAGGGLLLSAPPPRRDYAGASQSQSEEESSGRREKDDEQEEKEGNEQPGVDKG